MPKIFTADKQTHDVVKAYVAALPQQQSMARVAVAILRLRAFAGHRVVNNPPRPTRSTGQPGATSMAFADGPELAEAVHQLQYCGLPPSPIKALRDACRYLPMPPQPELLTEWLPARSVGTKEARASSETYRLPARVVTRLEAMAKAWDLSVDETVAVLLNTHPALVLRPKLTPQQVAAGVLAAAAVP